MELTIEEEITLLKQAVQDALDTKAMSLGYDNINSIAKFQGYVNDYQAEAEALGTWTANVWSFVEAEFIKVSNGERTLPTKEEVIAELPIYGA